MKNRKIIKISPNVVIFFKSNIYIAFFLSIKLEFYQMDKPIFLAERKLLGKRIMQLRNNCINENTGKKISQEELALRLGLAKNHIGLIERGQTNTTVDILYGIAKEFGVDIIELFNFSELKKDA